MDSGGGIRAQLKYRASATQQQPPINKRDYRRATSGISVQKDRSPAASQPGDGGCESLLCRILSSCPPPPLSLHVPFRSFSFFSLPPPRPSPIASFSGSLAHSPCLYHSSSVSHVYTHTHTYRRARSYAPTDILPSASGAHNKKVETLSPCGHVPHPPVAITG